MLCKASKLCWQHQGKKSQSFFTNSALFTRSYNHWQAFLKTAAAFCCIKTVNTNINAAIMICFSITKDQYYYCSIQYCVDAMIAILYAGQAPVGGQLYFTPLVTDFENHSLKHPAAVTDIFFAFRG